MEENRAAEMPEDLTKVDSVGDDRVLSPEVSQSDEFIKPIDDNGDDVSANERKVNSGGSPSEPRYVNIQEDVSFGSTTVDVEKIEYDDATSTKDNLMGNVRFGVSDEAETEVSTNPETNFDASTVQTMDKKVARNAARAETTTFLCPANRRVPIGRTIGKVISSRKQRMWDNFPGIFGSACRMSDWIPKMCACIESRANVSGNSRYQRLGSAPTLFQYSATVQSSHDAAEEPVDNERQAELTFYFGDNTCKKLTVEKNLRIVDLCELLKVNKNSIGNAWSIVETWSELGIERTLEDHEDILATHREMENFASHHDRKFYFLEDFTKYEVFVNPKQFFPRDMVAFPNDEDRGPIGDPEDALRRYLARDNTECPEVCSLIWIRHEGSTSWKKLHMLLQGRKLYTTRKGSFMNSKFPKTRLPTLSTRSNCINQRSLSPDPLPSTSNTTSITRLSGRFHHPNTGSTPKRMQDNEQPSTLAHLSDYYIYKISNAKKYFNAPYEWAVCLRPSSDAEAEDTEAGVRGIKVIAFTSEKARNCWLTAMRLAKYGKQLRENYRAFKNKQCDQNSGGSTKEQYTSYNVTNESLRSRVAMDFTGSVGRIVEDPKEAKDIAESEGITWRRRWRPFSRQRPGASTLVGLHGLDRGIHVLQPWFHSNLNREVAAAIIKEHGTVDGVFLVRESKSNPGSYVLTYKYNDKVFHCQIQAMFDERGDCWLFTLDRGVTKFYDLLQMIEFHQLNSGSLPTKLTHYVKSGVTPHQRPEDGGASPSPPSSSNRSSLSPKSPKSSSGIADDIRIVENNNLEINEEDDEDDQVVNYASGEVRQNGVRSAPSGCWTLFRGTYEHWDS